MSVLASSCKHGKFFTLHAKPSLLISNPTCESPRSSDHTNIIPASVQLSMCLSIVYCIRVISTVSPSSGSIHKGSVTARARP